MSSLKRFAALGGGAATDASFKNVTLLLHGNGTNGAQNNTFIDGSSNAFSITRNGNTTQGTFSPYGSNWSNYFDGTGDYIENTSNYLVASTTSTFTIEAWVFMTADPVDDANDIPAMISVNCGGGNNSFNYMAFGPISSRKLRIRWFDGTAKNAEGSTTLALNTWYHVACSVSSNAIKMFVNGVEETLSGTTTLTNRNGDANGFALGQTFTYANYTGYISNARVLSGTALYTTGFTPSTAPLTAITNTVLLTCQSNRFRDASSNAHAITTAGNTSVQRFSPFSPTAAYTPQTIGGSGYFDGSGDYISAPANAAFNFGTGDFTIEFWYYPNSISGPKTLIEVNYGTAPNFIMQPSSGVMNFYTNGVSASVISNVTDTIGSWYHYAAVRNGSTITLYRNGISVGTTTYSGNVGNSSAVCFVGGSLGGGGYYIDGYLSNVRVVKGTAVYTGNFTPPTAPLTAITNTSLLLNFTNAGIIDNAMMNDLETVGNAQISTTQSKFGGSSLYVNGSSRLRAEKNPAFDFRTGDFTIEWWMYLPVAWTSQPAQCGIVSYTNDGGYNPVGWVIYNDSGSKINFRAKGVSTNFETASTPATNQWQHWAITRSGGTLRWFKDGVLDSTLTNATGDIINSTVSPLYVGFSDPWSGYLNGYIDDLRITRGVARYTANFTAPTAPFADQ